MIDVAVIDVATRGQDGVIRVALADDHPLLLAAMRRRLDREPDIAVVGVAGDGDEIVRVHAEARPQVVVVDVDMPGQGGVDAIREMRRADPGLRAIVFSGRTDAVEVIDAAEAGARGFMLKSATGEQLVEAVRAVGSGGVAFDEFAARAIIERVRRPPVAEAELLSERQLDVLELLARGRSRQEIAGELDIGENTVSTHLKHVYRRLGAPNRVAAVRRAVDLGLLDRQGRRLPARARNGASAGPGLASSFAER